MCHFNTDFDSVFSEYLFSSIYLLSDQIHPAILCYCHQFSTIQKYPAPGFHQILGTVTRTATVMRSTTTFNHQMWKMPNRLWWELISQMKQRIRIPSPIHLELIVISANISPIFLKKITRWVQGKMKIWWRTGWEVISPNKERITVQSPIHLELILGPIFHQYS